mmetsp:Transcript_38541/g.116515  ORF Transcript_38541/g.116515 Transcript_38541/m.116515 type:complete len:244 (+) Transcript_38541:1987-2718(+)
MAGLGDPDAVVHGLRAPGHVGQRRGVAHGHYVRAAVRPDVRHQLAGHGETDARRDGLVHRAERAAQHRQLAVQRAAALRHGLDRRRGAPAAARPGLLELPADELGVQSGRELRRGRRVPLRGSGAEQRRRARLRLRPRRVRRLGRQLGRLRRPCVRRGIQLGDRPRCETVLEHLQIGRRRHHAPRLVLRPDAPDGPDALPDPGHGETVRGADGAAEWYDVQLRRLGDAAGHRNCGGGWRLHGR